MAYLTEEHKNNPTEQVRVQKFYNEVILTLENKELLHDLQTFHSYIGILLRDMKNKQVGQNFGRSGDGISVKPFIFSGKCQESSQRSFVLSTILEACLDYFVNGISEQGVGAYLAQVRQAAEIKAVGPLDDTKIGKLFKERFGCFLTKVRAEDYAKIREKINQDPDIWEEALEAIYLKNYTYYELKIEGSSDQLQYESAEFAGSSGSSERVNTLPESIEKHPELILQEGAMGSVFYKLLLNFNNDTDITTLDASQPLEQQIAALLRPGDTLIDNGPYFPSLSGFDIVKKIAAHKQENQKYRFLDEQENVVVWDGNRLQKADTANLDLKKTYNVIDHKGRQGTNWMFAPGTSGVVEKAVDTDLSSFSQSLMRLRLLGKGQTAKILCDTDPKLNSANNEKIKDKSALTQIIFSLIHNEALLLKRFHTQANRRAIKAIYKRVKNCIEKNVEVETLAALKELPQFNLTTATPLRADIYGPPVILGDTTTVLDTLRQAEKSTLYSLQQSVRGLKIDAKDKNFCLRMITQGLLSLCLPEEILPVVREELAYESKTVANMSEKISTKEEIRSQLKTFLAETKNLENCQKTIEEALAILDKPPLIMLASLLLDKIPIQFIDIDSVEDMEIEMSVEETNDVEIQQEQANLELETEAEYFQEQVTEEEIDKTRPHPSNQEGKELTLSYLLPFYAPWNASLNLEKPKNHKNYALFPIHSVDFPYVWATNHAVGYSGEAELPPKRVEDALWIYSKPKQKAIFSPKVFIVITKDGRVGCQMGSQKDADLFFDSYRIGKDSGRLQELADVRVGRSESKKEITNFRENISYKLVERKTDDFVLYSIQDKKNPLDKSYYCNDYSDLEHLTFYKLDLREPTLPPSLIDATLRKKVQTCLAYAKIISLEGTLSEEEKIIVSKWLPKDKSKLKKFEKNLIHYLSSFYGRPASHEILDLIQKALKS